MLTSCCKRKAVKAKQQEEESNRIKTSHTAKLYKEEYY